MNGFNQMNSLDTHLSIQTIQQIYDNANPKVKAIIEKIFPKWKLESDFDNIDDTLFFGVKYASYENYYTVGTLKSTFGKPCHWEYSSTFSDKIWNKLCELPDDTPLKVLWNTPRDDYAKDFVTGFYILKKR